MNPADSRKKRQSRSNRVDAPAVGVVTGGAQGANSAPIACVFPTNGAPGVVDPVAGGAQGASSAPNASVSPSSGAIGAVDAVTRAAPGSHPPVVNTGARGTAGVAFAPGANEFPWWPATSPGSSDRMYPSGGFQNFIQAKNPPFTQTHPFVNYPHTRQLPENFYFVGGQMSHSTMSPTATSYKGAPSPTGSSIVDGAQIGSQENEPIDVENDNTIQPPARSDRRLNWSNDEDIRLVSAWLHNSIDLVDGNDKKSDQYWSDVTSTYNSSTKCNRMRNRNQLKLRWERIKKPVTEFNGCYARITKVHQSGMSDDQKMDKAMQLYASEHSDKPFTMLHIWRILRHERKWGAYVKKLSKEKEKSIDLAHVVNVEDAPKQRPIGRQQAKEERKGKRKEPEAISAISEKLEKFIEATSKTKKIAEVQQSLANKKLEVAKEQTKIKMLDLYRELLCAPTSDLTEEAKAERSKALESMAMALFPKDN